MQKSNINGALILLTNETFQMLALKHPEALQAHNDAILPGSKRQVHSNFCEDIDGI